MRSGFGEANFTLPPKILMGTHHPPPPPPGITLKPITFFRHVHHLLSATELTKKKTVSDQLGTLQCT